MKVELVSERKSYDLCLDDEDFERAERAGELPRAIDVEGRLRIRQVAIHLRAERVRKGNALAGLAKRRKTVSKFRNELATFKAALENWNGGIVESYQLEGLRLLIPEMEAEVSRVCWQFGKWIQFDESKWKNGEPVELRRGPARQFGFVPLTRELRAAFAAAGGEVKLSAVDGGIDEAGNSLRQTYESKFLDFAYALLRREIDAWGENLSRETLGDRLRKGLERLKNIEQQNASRKPVAAGKG